SWRSPTTASDRRTYDRRAGSWAGFWAGAWAGSESAGPGGRRPVASAGPAGPVGPGESARCDSGILAAVRHLDRPPGRDPPGAGRGRPGAGSLDRTGRGATAALV